MSIPQRTLWIILAAFPVSWALTWMVRVRARALGVVDLPNNRSSHRHPVPRGGGLGIAVAFLCGVGLFGLLGVIPPRMAAAFFGGGAMVALVGWLDDRYGLTAAIRAVVHLAAAIWMVAWNGSIHGLSLGSITLPLGMIGPLLAAVAIVWLTNLYNFMDGIDGIAGAQAVVAGAGGAVIASLCGNEAVALIALLLASASLGLLPHNWPPARVFMGDVSSGLLGYAFAGLAIFGETSGGPTALSWAILLGVFVVDATMTLAERTARREKWHEAHRCHAYQRMVDGGASHRRVTMGVVWLGVCLWALALISELRPGAKIWVAAVVLLVLVVGRKAILHRLGVKMQKNLPMNP